MYLMRLCLKSFFLIFLISCQDNESVKHEVKSKTPAEILEKTIGAENIIVGAAQVDTLKQLLINESVAIVANQTSTIGTVHLVDTLIGVGISVKKVFSPEHGFRGDADAGATVESGLDVKTGLPIVSLYGSNKKPTKDQLSGITTVVFDIQDVGARFYTYISTMHYIMEACAENNINVIVLDRPNPNGHYVDGPVRKEGFESFVSMHPIPIVHGMTVGELAKMINGEGWLKDQVKCDLVVIPMLNYSRDSVYSLPIPPSPNLRSDASVTLYPSLCLFEGTVVSVGRGTERPFEVYGHPQLINGEKDQYRFVPSPGFGAQHPKLEGETCYGEDLGMYYREKRMKQFDLKWLLSAYQNYQGEAPFFTKGGRFFDLLAGSSELREQIVSGKTEQEIRGSWSSDLKEFKEKRSNYLLYP